MLSHSDIEPQSDVEPQIFYGKPQSYIEPHSCVELAGTLGECPRLRASEQSWVVVHHNLGTSKSPGISMYDSVFVISPFFFLSSSFFLG